MNTATETPIYEVKNVKTFTGREGHGWSCSLYANGKRLGDVTDTASGGPVNFYIEKGELVLLGMHCALLPKRPWGFEGDDLDPEGCKVDPDIFVSDLVGDFIENKDMKRKCKTRTVFTLKDGDPKDIWLMKSIFSERVKKHLQDKHGDNLKEIINERFV